LKGKIKLDFYENNLVKETLNEYYDTFSRTLDTAEYVPEKFNAKISKYIYKKMQQKFCEIEIYTLLHLEENGYKLGLFQKLKIAFSGLRPLYNAQKQKSEMKLSRKKQRVSQRRTDKKR
jgi:hypothetical protein